MKTIIEETPETKEQKIDWNNLDTIVNEKPVTSADSLDADLNEYKNAGYTITQDVQETNTETDHQSNEPELDKNLYYVSGKKKGQLRPNKTKVSYNPSKPATLSGEFLTGAIVIMLIDILLPLLFAGINNTVSKKKIDADKLKLTDKQKKEFEPIADAVLKSIKIEANPVLVLAVGLVGAYGMNFYLIKNDIEQ